MTRITIDPNVRIHGNDTYAGFEDITGGPVAVGEPVTVVEIESHLIGEGRVTHISEESKLVYLSVDWASLQPEQGGGTGQDEDNATLSLFVASHHAGEDFFTLVISPKVATTPEPGAAKWAFAAFYGGFLSDTPYQVPMRTGAMA